MSSPKILICAQQAVDRINAPNINEKNSILTFLM